MSGSRSMLTRLTPLLIAAASVGGSPTAAQRSSQGPVPAETVVRLTMETPLSSRTARANDLFAAVLADADRSGFPGGTRFQGVVREVHPRTDRSAGVLDVQIRRAYLPAGGKIELDGQLASLAEDDVRRMEDGRLEARSRPSSAIDWKWTGGADGAGAVLSAVAGGKVLKVGGGPGGGPYGYLPSNGSEKAPFRDVELPRGTEFGMRLEQQIPFAARSTYWAAGDEAHAERRRAASARTEGWSRGERPDLFYREATVQLNGRPVALDEPPMNLNGILYVPLAPIAAAARLRLTHRAGEEAFALATAAGQVRACAGETRVILANRRALTLSEEPVSFNGTIFVSAEYLARAASLSPHWDAANLRLHLRSRP